MNIGLILYISSGLLSEDHYIGYGFHGYTFKEGNTPRGLGIKGFNPTNKGYIDKKDTKTKYELITPTKLINELVVKNIDKENINNTNTSITLLLNSLLVIKNLVEKEDNIKDIIIYTVDEKIVNNFKVLDTLNQDNDDLKKIIELVNELKEKYTINVLLSEETNLGIEKAKRLALMASSKSLSVDNSKFSMLAPVDEFFKDIHLPHPFFCMKRFFFNPSRDNKEDNEFVYYYLGNPGDGVPDKFQGKAISDSALALVKLINKDKVIETIKDKQKELLDLYNINDDNIIIGMLNEINIARVYNEFYFGEDLLVKNEKINARGYDLKSIEDKELTKVMIPPYLSMRTLDNFKLMRIYLDKYLNKEWRYLNSDITNLIYDIKEDKSKQIKKTDLKIEFDKIKSFNVPFLINNKEKIITLTLDIDLPSRNYLKRIAEYNPKVELLVYPEEGIVYRYFVIITLENNEAIIWYNVFSNQILL